MCIRDRPTLSWVLFVAVSLMIFLLALRVMPTRAKPAGPLLQFHRAGAIFGFSASILLVVPFLVSHLYERYLIPVVPMAMVLLVCLVGPRQGDTPRVLKLLSVVLAGLALVAFAALSVLFSHDSLLWNRLRWQAVNMLVDEMKVDPAAVDGGLTVSGWYLFPTEGPLRQRYARSPSESGQWWRNDGAEYIVAISTPMRLERMIAAARREPDEQLDVVWKRSFIGWLPGADGEVLVCRGRLCSDVFKKKSPSQ